MTKIEKFPANPDGLIAFYHQKWRRIALNCQSVDRTLSVEAVNKLYDLLGLARPEIIFYSSPYEIISELAQRNFKYNIGLKIYQIYLNFTQDFILSTHVALAQFEAELDIPTGIIKEIYREMSRQIKALPRINRPKIPNWQYNFFFPQFKAYELSVADFSISELNHECDREYWHIFNLLASSCCAIYPCEKIVFISDRPKQINLDKNNRLHSESEPALEFRDGFNIHAYRGIDLPEKYQKIPPNTWPSDWYLNEPDLDLKWQLIETLPSELLQLFWLLEETNSELKTRLIQRLGYKKICQQLPNKKIDSWREYDLLKIQAKIDCEPIHCLKMTCTSTNKIHVLRVPPHLNSARKAIEWVNWNIDSKEFTIET